METDGLVGENVTMLSDQNSHDSSSLSSLMFGCSKFLVRFQSAEKVILPVCQFILVSVEEQIIGDPYLAIFYYVRVCALHLFLIAAFIVLDT